MSFANPPGPLKGRGTSSVAEGRFASRRIEHDLAALAEAGDGALSGMAPATVLHEERPRSIVSTNASPDVPFDQSINPYRGCEHGCVYCYARTTHSYLDLSPGLDFETQIYFKTGAAELLRRRFDNPRYRCEPITIGANTDPYQPAEKTLAITRELLQVFAEYSHPVSIITKGSLIRRDIDLLAPLAERGLVSVAISIPTLDSSLKRVLEPRVPSAQSRLSAVRALSDAGVPVTVLAAPVIPALTDCELERILEKARSAGAQGARYILLRLPHEVAPLFRRWLSEHAPGRAAHVMSLVRSAHGGRDYDSRFGRRQRGEGAYADMIAQRFRAACRRLGLDDAGPGTLDTEQFRRPGAATQTTFAF